MFIFSTSRDVKMAVEDLKMQRFLWTFVVPSFATVTMAWIFRRFLKHHIYSRSYAWLINRFAKKINAGKATKAKKVQLFEKLKTYQQKRSKGLHILELGSGSAANIDYFPRNTTLVCLDPNPHFVGYIKNNVNKAENVISTEICQGYAENMPFEEEQFDAVVCTLVLCTVADPKKSLAEVLRVLKPGGVFLYMEHVAEKKETWTWKIQGWMNPLWRVIGDGCELRRDTASLIKAAGFSSNQIEFFQLKKVPIVLRRWIYGTAVK